MLFAWTKATLAILSEFYSDPLPIFHEEKEPQNYFSYTHFAVRSFRGLVILGQQTKAKFEALLLALKAA